jgi:uncharacterized membrane protein
MKTLKISVAATLASTIAWWLGIPRAVWPAHPWLADTALAIITYVILQFAWTNAKDATTKKPAVVKSSIEND